MKKAYLAVFAIVLVLAIASVPRGLCYPPAGYDYMTDTTAVLVIRIIAGPITFTETITAKGPTNVTRSNSSDPGDGHWKIDTEIVSMNLVGESVYLGEMNITENSTSASMGAIRQIAAGDDFPATSFFDVFVEIQTIIGTIHNNESVRMSTIIYTIPPQGVNYRSTNTPIPLRDATGAIIGYILDCMHQIPTKGGGITVPVDKFGLLAPYIGLTSTILGATLATAAYVKRSKRKK